MTTATYDIAVDTVLFHEGFGTYTDDKADPGGPTRWGMSLKYLEILGDDDGDGWLDGDLDHDGDVDADDIRLMTRDKAKEILLSRFWNRYGYDRLFSGRLACKIFDLAVNMGPSNAHKVLQRACRASGDEVADDGILGKVTLAAANSSPQDALFAACRSEAAGHYRRLISRRPVLKKYQNGWLNRAYS